MSSEGTPLHGDRGAWNTMSFDTEHAKDIADSTLRRHLPLPGAAGGIAQSDGTDWQRVSSLPLADIAGYARGYIIRGGASDWEAHDASTSGFILVGDGTDIASVCFDWDTMAGGASADMVHTHASAGEGGQISHDSGLTGVSVDDHHSETHIINSTGPHAEASLTIGHFLRATGAAAFSFAAIAAGDLPTAIDAAKIADGSVSNTEFQYLDDYATIGLVDLTTGEVNQLENIAATTISAAQWAYLGAMNQGLATTDSPTFNALTATSIIIGGNTITTTEWANLDGLNQTLATTSSPTFASLTLSGATGTNVITVPDALADALHLSDAGGLEYMRIVSTNAQPIVEFNPGEVDIDFIVNANGRANAIHVDGATGFVGFGVAPTYYHDVYDAAVNTTVAYTGIRNQHVKTLGASDHDDTMMGFFNRLQLNQPGGVVGYTYGIYGEARLTAGSVGSLPGNPRSILALQFFCDLDGGTVTSSAYGASVRVDQEAANTVNGNIYGLEVHVDSDGTVDGEVRLLYLYDGSNVDYGIYQVGTSPHYLGGRLAVGGTVGALAQVHIDQSVYTAAIPALLLDQSDINIVLMKVIAAANAAGVDYTLVADSDFGTPGALVGWIQIEIEDVGDRIADGDYYVPFYQAPS